MEGLPLIEPLGYLDFFSLYSGAGFGLNSFQQRQPEG
jgi:hypothetical protein